MANGTSAANPNEVSYLQYEGKHKGIWGWLLTTDHKRIGLMYLIVVMTFFFVAMTLGLLMRMEMLKPEGTIMSAQTYNSVFTLHGVIMVFLFIIPGLPAIFGNFMMPIQIGAKDVAFPRLNLFSWYLYIGGGLFAIISLFTGGGAADTGWTFYVPYSIRSAQNVSMTTLAAFILGFSSIVTGINFIVTIHRLRAPGMTWFRMPLFVWAIYATSWIQVLATPVIGITLILIVLERAIGIGIFDPSLGGDPLLYEHMFWIYSHPAVYIMILPAMGVVSEIIPTFSRKDIFGYKQIAISSLAIAIIGYLVWGHHMFSSGISDTARAVFSLLTFLVAIPTGVKVFNWVASFYKASVKFSAPLYFVMAFVFLFSVGGLTGLVLGTLATDIHLTKTYFVVAHFHYVMFGGMGTIFFASFHYWFPKMFGKMYNEKIAILSCSIFIIGFNMLYFTFFIMGFLGMPRRYYHYLPQYSDYQVFATVGSWIMVAGIVLMFGNLIYALLKGPKATANPWGGTTLEWQVPSPPPVENFEEIPVVVGGPYVHYKSSYIMHPGEEKHDGNGSAKIKEEAVH